MPHNFIEFLLSYHFNITTKKTKSTMVSQMFVSKTILYIEEVLKINNQNA